MDYSRAKTLHPALLLKGARQWPMKLNNSGKLNIAKKRVILPTESGYHEN
jgi:hypothetical protein